MKKVDILGVSFANVSPSEAVDVICGYMDTDSPHIVYTPNPEMVMLAQKDQEFKNILDEADMNIPDGIGIVYGAAIKRTPLQGRVAGYDTVQSVFNRMKDSGKSVYFFGGAPGVADKAKENMEKRCTVPFDRETADSLMAGDCVYLTGTIYTARDAAHKRMQEALDAAQETAQEALDAL